MLLNWSYFNKNIIKNEWLWTPWLVFLENVTCRSCCAHVCKIPFRAATLLKKDSSTGVFFKFSEISRTLLLDSISIMGGNCHFLKPSFFFDKCYHYYYHHFVLLLSLSFSDFLLFWFLPLKIDKKNYWKS